MENRSKARRCKSMGKYNTPINVYVTSSQFGTKFFFVMKKYYLGPNWSEVTAQLPDNLSESEIPANSSGIKFCSAVSMKSHFYTICVEVKINFCSTCAEVKNAIFRTGLVQFLHEVTSCQVGEKSNQTSSRFRMKCHGLLSTCSQIGDKSGQWIFQNNLCPTWS